MIFRFTMKTPDVLDYYLAKYSKEEQEKITAVADRYLKYCEYLQLEIDTEAGTCVAVKIAD